MRRAAIDDQKYRVRGSNHQTFEKLGSTARRRTSSAAESFASQRQRSTSETAHPVSADARTKASPSRRPSRRADTAPTIHIPSTDSARERGRQLRAFAFLDLTHRAFTQRFQRMMIQSACIIFLHTGSESLNTCTVNKSRYTYELFSNIVSLVASTANQLPRQYTRIGFYNYPLPIT